MRITKAELLEMIEKAKRKNEEIFAEPIEDPGAPAGFVRREVYEAEKRRRIEAVLALMDEIADAAWGDDELSKRRRDEYRRRKGRKAD